MTLTRSQVSKCISRLAISSLRRSTKKPIRMNLIATVETSVFLSSRVVASWLNRQSSRNSQKKKGLATRVNNLKQSNMSWLALYQRRTLCTNRSQLVPFETTTNVDSSLAKAMAKAIAKATVGRRIIGAASANSMKPSESDKITSNQSIRLKSKY
jgi:uncharacterized protein YacL (UPF0231 family)